MSATTHTEQVPANRDESRWAFFGAHKASILVSPVLSLILLMGIWYGLEARIDADRTNVTQTAQADAKSLARTYADWLERSILQVDQLSLLIKYEWEHAQHADYLELLTQRGAFPGAQFSLVTIIDAKGMLRTGSLPVSRNSMSDRDYFVFHRAHAGDQLRIGEPTTGRVSGKPVIQFTRRIENHAGEFDGVVLISVQPSFFLGYYSLASLGSETMLAVTSEHGAIKAAGIGQLVQDDTLQPVLKGAWPPGLFTTTQGFIDSSLFADHVGRIVGIHPVRRYPLMAVVGVSLNERLQPYQDRWYVMRLMALCASGLVLILGSLGTAMAVRMAWRSHQDAQMQRAYRVATEGVKDGLFMLRPLYDLSHHIHDFQVADCNERGAAFSGYTAEQFLGLRLSHLYQKPYFFDVLETFRKAFETGFYEDELKIPPESPVQIEWAHRRLTRVGEFLAFTMRDISHVKAHEQQLWRMANEDNVTQLPNRNWLADHLASLIATTRANAGHGALILIDIDNFKAINDMHGHATGNELLRSIAARLRSHPRQEQIVARLGSDEFAIVLHPCTDAAHACEFAQMVANKLRQPMVFQETRFSIGTAIGVCLFPDHAEEAETLIAHADIAMHHAKSTGMTGPCLYQPELTVLLKKRIDAERSLMRAIDLEQFVLHYQPRVRCDTGELLGFEALVRWQHPTRGLILPGEFIAIAEMSGAISRLGELVIDLACRQLRDWRHQNLPVVPVSINVSPHQFRQDDVLAILRSKLVHYETPTELLQVEITESSMMDNGDKVYHQLAGLRSLGIQLLIDDFGTGHSSLAQLQAIDTDEVKVDRAFTSRLQRNAPGEVFFRAILSMAHALGLTVVAEGTETEEQLAILRDIGCDAIQGFLISPPVPADQAREFMIRRFLTPNLDGARPDTEH